MLLSAFGDDLQVVDDTLHAARLPRELLGTRLLLRSLDGAVEVHGAVIRVDIDPREIRGFVGDELRLDRRRDTGVVDVGTHALSCERLTAHGQREHRDDDDHRPRHRSHAPTSCALPMIKNAGDVPRSSMPKFSLLAEASRSRRRSLYPSRVPAV